jgi:hypothetical protein
MHVLLNCSSTFSRSKTMEKLNLTDSVRDYFNSVSKQEVDIHHNWKDMTRLRATSSEQCTLLAFQHYTTQVAFQVWPPKRGSYLLILLMMGILVPKPCWGNKTAYFVASSWFFTFAGFWVFRVASASHSLDFFVCFNPFMLWVLCFNPLLVLFKSLLPGQEDCVFFSGHLNLHAKPETGIPYSEKN